MDLTREVAYRVGFEYRIQFVKDESYGAKQDNGTWNGMVGEVSRHVSVTCSVPLLDVHNTRATVNEIPCRQ